MASFQAKIGRKRMRNRETKIIIPIRSHPKRNRKFHKKIKKTKTIPLWLHYKPKYVKKG